MKGNSDTLTSFSMESILTLPRGEVKEFSTPMTDRKGHLKLVITDTVGIMEGIMISDKATMPLTHYNDKPLVEMNFMLEGSICQTHEGLLKQHHYAKGYHNILFNPYSQESNHLMHAGSHRIFSAHVLPEYMISLLSGYLPEFIPLAEKIEKGTPFVLHSPINMLNSQLRYFFETFWETPLSTSLHKLYFDAKVLDLLCRQCEVLIGRDVKGIKISKTDLEKIHFVRDIILTRLSSPPSLTELSRLSGLNEFKLKKYFREVFNTSVFGMLHEERLQMAKKLIYQGGKNISMIAYELGYAHPQHFQRAFKKRFGITPTGLLK